MILLNYKEQSIVAISDTHGRHRDLDIPLCDILIHCGDICTDGDENQIIDFFKWFSAQPATHKLFVSGNHDYPFVFEPINAINLIPKNVIFMDNKAATIQNINFMGLYAPYNLHDIPEIPLKKVDFLLTHVPPKSIIDDGLGCPYLKKFVKKVNPAFHVFGHIHHLGNKKIQNGQTLFINACNF